MLIISPNYLSEVFKISPGSNIQTRGIFHKLKCPFHQINTSKIVLPLNYNEDTNMLMHVCVTLILAKMLYFQQFLHPLFRHLNFFPQRFIVLLHFGSRK